MACCGQCQYAVPNNILIRRYIIILIYVYVAIEDSMDSSLIYSWLDWTVGVLLFAIRLCWVLSINVLWISFNLKELKVNTEEFFHY